MPRIHDTWLDCAVYLYKSKEDALRGEKSGGSGFLLGVPSVAPEPLTIPPIEESWQRRVYIGGPPPDPWSTGEPFLYVVTNQHVIDDGYTVARLNTKESEGRALDAIPLPSWSFHATSDLAVHMIPWSPQLHHFSIAPFDSIMTTHNCMALDVGIGDDVFSVGRLINHAGKQRNLPVLRFGNIAMMPHEPIMVQYRDPDGSLKPAGKRPQDSFLVESRTVPGYSGAPVFLRVPAWELRESGDWRRRSLYEYLSDAKGGFNAVQLLGVTWGFIWGQAEVVRNTAGHDVGKANLNSGMAGVIPAWKLLELLNTQKLIDERNEMRQHKQPPAGAPA